MNRYFSMMPHSRRATNKHARSGDLKPSKLIGVERQRDVKVSQPLSNQTLARHAKSGGGSSLPDDLQKQWGSRLGQDLSRFRVHANGSASEAVRNSGANAISYGNNLFFANGTYNPASSTGQELIGHELAHGLQSKPVNASSAVMPHHDPSLENKANQVGSDLAGSNGPINMSNIGEASPALRGDKQISFSGNTITVSDTYVIYGPAANSAYVTKFQEALDQYYNSPAITYRGYTVNFNLSVRLKQSVTRTVGLFDWESTDWSSDTDTSMFYVAIGNDTAGGYLEITLYDSSTKGTIAHEVGHYLSDRIGYFSEGYSESVTSRLGITDRHTTVDSDAIMTDGTVDIMARSQTGSITEFSLGGILDAAINGHEYFPDGVEFDHVGGDFCWVAREVIPEQWRLVRLYLLTSAPIWFRDAYGKYGLGFARYIHDKPMIKRFLRPVFLVLAEKGRVLLSQSHTKKYRTPDVLAYRTQRPRCLTWRGGLFGHTQNGEDIFMLKLANGRLDTGL